MTMIYASQSSAGVGGGSSLPFDKPAGTLEGDVLIAILSAQVASGTVVFTPPAGWSALGADVSLGSLTRSQVFTKIAGASEPTTYTWDATPAPSLMATAMLRYAPQSPTVAPGVIDASAAGTGAAPAVAPSVTANGNNDTWVVLFSAGAVGAAPAGMTQRVAIDPGQPGVWVYDKLLTTIGATGSVEFTGSSTGGGWSILLFANSPSSGSRIRMMV